MKNPFINALQSRLKVAVGRVCENAYAVYSSEMEDVGKDPMTYEEFLEAIKVKVGDIENA